MTTWYYVTVGRSLRDSSRCWKPDKDTGRPKYVSDFDNRAFSAMLDQNGGARAIGNCRIWAEDCMRQSEDPDTALECVKSRFDEACWSEGRIQALPAELATLYRLSRADKSPITCDDHIVFVHAKGAGDGAVADDSMRNDALLMKGVLQLMNQKQQFPVGNSQITIRDQGQWDPTRSGMFVKSIWNLYDLMFDNPPSERDAIGLVLTGGYKGIGLILLAAAARDMDELNIFYLHEESPSLVAFNTREVREKFQEYRK